MFTGDAKTAWYGSDGGEWFLKFCEMANDALKK
jgi:hypothetical protein